jgi:hypothetical protein
MHGYVWHGAPELPLESSKAQYASTICRVKEMEKIFWFLQLRNVEDNLERSVVDASGNPLPPCIVMERGESLDFWVAHARPDRAQAISVCFPP